jgi:uncharacterized protein
MRYKLLDETNGRRRFVLALEAEEAVMATLTAFAKAQSLGGASISAIGAFSKASLGHFNPVTKEFTRNEIDEQTEVVSMIGNIALEDDDSHRVHIHVALGCRDASVKGGHLIEGFVRPTLELILEESPAHMQRGIDASSGLVLLQL